MNNLQQLTQQFKSIQNDSNPVVYSWNKSLDSLDFFKESPWRKFGEMFADSHPDLKSSPNSYHNQIHSAEAIFSSAILLKAEFSCEENHYFAPYLLFGMMCHDICHNGTHNKKPYELEKLAVNSMKSILKEEKFQTFWNEHFLKDYGTINKFTQRISRIILGTEFKVGIEKNISAYQNNSQNNPFVKINTLANEADIFVSVLKNFGIEKGKLLAEEQQQPVLATDSGRAFFLQNLAKYTSIASKKLGIQEHIQGQILFNSVKYSIKKTRESYLTTLTKKNKQSLHN